MQMTPEEKIEAQIGRNLIYIATGLVLIIMLALYMAFQVERIDQLESEVARMSKTIAWIGTCPNKIAVMTPSGSTTTVCQP